MSGGGGVWWRWAVRGAFFCYAALLHTVTHWPQLRLIEAPFSWFDKVVHFGAFAVWTLGFALCGWFGPALSKRNLRWSLVFGLVAGAIDELTQGLPMVNRDPDLLDWVADALGAASAIGFLHLARAAFSPPGEPRRDDRK